MKIYHKFLHLAYDILIMICLGGCPNCNYSPVNNTPSMEVKMESSNVDCNSNKTTCKVDELAYTSNGQDNTFHCEIVRQSDNFTVYSASNLPFSSGDESNIITLDCASLNVPDSYSIFAFFNDVNGNTYSDRKVVSFGNSDPNRRPTCVLNNINNKHIEYNCMVDHYGPPLNDWYHFYLHDVNWDSEMQAAYLSKCNVKLNFNTSNEGISWEILNTGTSDQSILTKLNDFYSAHHYTNEPYWICGIDKLTYYGTVTESGGMTNSNKTWSYVFVGRIYDEFGSNYRTDARRHVEAHELGHQFGLGHNSHGGNGEECCIMWVDYLHGTCESSVLYFCDNDACFLYQH